MSRYISSSEATDDSPRASTCSDERFHTPRAQASSNRSTGSFATPRSSRTEMTSARSFFGSSSSESEFITPRSTSLGGSSHHHPMDVSSSSFHHHHAAQNQSAPLLIHENYTRQRLPPAYSTQKEQAGTFMTHNHNHQQQNDDADHDIFSLARHNRVKDVEELLNRGVSVNITDENGNTILLTGCQNGSKRIAKLALRYGADINASNNRGNTALHFSFKYGFGKTLGAYLISKGADANIRNKDGFTCMEISA